jgi:hypothetical protein
MPINNFSLYDLTRRIIINLPSKFDAEEGTNVYKFFEAIANGFQLTSNKIDELAMQTNLVTATGVYVDDYINGLAAMGRYTSGIVYPDSNEADQQYKDRYKSTIYKHNSTKTGLQQIFIDFFESTPRYMYTGARNGAFGDAGYFYDSGNLALWGADTYKPYTGYIELYRKPNEWVIEQLLVSLRKAQGFGIDLFIVFPDESDEIEELTLDFTEGELELMETY